MKKRVHVYVRQGTYVGIGQGGLPVCPRGDKG